MRVTGATLLALQCTLCLAIRIPNAWINENSEVNKNKFAFQAQNVASDQKPIPTEYFQYPARKPNFAVDIAKIHGVRSPEDHFQAYSIEPHTGIPKAKLGKHQILNKEKQIFHPFQEFVKKSEAIRVVSPSTTSYEVFHPYKSEVPALKELYRNPVMDKIRNDLENNKIRLQKYENEASQPNIIKNEYLENPEETDRKKLPHKNVPVPYEIHRHEHRPVYYKRPSVQKQREEILNQKLKHPWHQDFVKIKPVNYRPVVNHLQRLKDQHAVKYDDERNEYPQLPIPEKDDETPEGYDIYEKGKEKFVQLRNNVDESINEAVQNNRPKEIQKLELIEDESDEDTNIDEDDEDNFVPVKNYAQVRKTETTKHLPKEAAYHDADTLEEIQNAPRLREAIKSTKAQTVYSEEGYEDSAYDHAGEQKHASDHEEHKGSLKQKELSNGKFKSPTHNSKYQDEEGSEYRDQILDGKSWKNSKKNTDKEADLEEYSENEQENSNESDAYVRKTKDNENDTNEDEDESDYDSRDEEIKRIKREQANPKIDNDENSSKNLEKVNAKHSNNEPITKINVPEIKLITSDVSEKDIIPLSTSIVLNKSDNINVKYPYYFNKIKGINKDSPLRYAENLKFIPNKSEGGTEFYDSREKIQCPEVEDNLDPIPEKLKKGGHPDDNDDEYDDAEDEKEIKQKNEPSVLNQTPRLKGLGDKIDCFKAKYFGENPLDSPFFNEDIISHPEPVIIPSIDIYRLKQAKQQSTQSLKLNDKSDLKQEIIERKKDYELPQLEESKPNQNEQQSPLINFNNAELTLSNTKDKLASLVSDSEPKSQVNLKSNQSSTIQTSQQTKGTNTINIVRKRRAAPFVYEPYKIIRDSQIQDSKKTTTTNNISPLIKQLQSSRVVDKVSTNTGKDQIVKRSTGSRPYKDIGKIEREKNIKSKGSQPLYDTSFVDVSIDQRRGEPRYELRAANYNNQYSPVENKRSSTTENYKEETKVNKKNTDQQEDQSFNKRKPNRRRRTTTTRPFFDVSKFLPQEETDKTKIITKQPISSQLSKNLGSNDSKEDYTDDNNNKQNVQKTITTKSPLRRRITDTVTTIKPDMEDDLPKLHLVTRFKNSDQTETPVTQKNPQIPSHSYEDNEKITAPKYREKKKKISKSTLVTDTNSYGEDDDDDLIKEEEVDALIGVKHDIEEYIPTYETESGKKGKSSENDSESQEDEEDFADPDHSYGNEDDGHNDDDDDDEEDEEDDDEDDEEQDDDEEIEIEESLKPEATTSEPTKRTLTKTTEAPLTTTEARSAKLEIEPVVVRKQIDIHKELPVNRSSPHITQFKQDIEEVEITKETPSRKKKKPQKNIEALELYKDENLAKDINKLGDVEVFKEGLDLINGPKHGGNYRIAEVLSTDDSPVSSSLRRKNDDSSKGDVEASPSKTSKVIEIKDDSYSRRRSDIQRARNNRNKNAKLIELSDSTEKPTSRPMHGGNFKSIHDVRRRGGNRNSKLIELVDQANRDDHSTNKHDSNSRSYGSRGGDRHQMHGGNYRSAKIVKPDEKTRTQSKKDTTTDDRQNSAVLLNSFARAVSVLTTPTPYILDPSKRMYYYVEA